MNFGKKRKSASDTARVAMDVPAYLAAPVSALLDKIREADSQVHCDAGKASLVRAIEAAAREIARRPTTKEEKEEIDSFWQEAERYRLSLGSAK